MARPQEFDSREVLVKAMDVFWTKGYEGTSLSDLLHATGLSKSSLYASFGDKRQLFISAFDTYRHARGQEMNIIMGKGNGREAVMSFFTKIIDDARDQKLSRGCMSINQCIELAPHDLEVRQKVTQDFAEIEAGLEKAIRRGQQDRSISSSKPSTKLARLLVLGFPSLQIMARAGLDSSHLHDTLHILLSVLD